MSTYETHARPNTPFGLSRPREGRMIGGVAAGLAKRFGITPTGMRVIFVLSCILPGPQFLIYLALWLIIPSDD